VLREAENSRPRGLPPNPALRADRQTVARQSYGAAGVNLGSAQENAVKTIENKRYEQKL